ncbi:MAG TPA: hypothetical protein VMG08_19300 [Allosphingosinicella sp.]|nr:hypothetical protein [Allosphingosinicella sp.]
MAQPGPADTPATREAAIRTLIDRWYVEQRAREQGRVQPLLAPGAHDLSPGYVRENLRPGARALVLGPPVYVSLAATALTFRHEITRIVLDTRFARVWVRERGYFYAAAAQRTYERMASASFVLERQDDGRWLVLVHESNPVGFPPSLATVPMPDLRELYYSTVGRDRDPEADARAARNF